MSRKTIKRWLQHLPNHSCLLMLLVFASSGAVVEGLLAGYQHGRGKDAELHALSFAGELRSRVERELNAVLFLTSGLSSYLELRKGELDPAEIRAMLANLYRNSRHVRVIAVAEQTRIQYAYPLVGNEKLIGLDYRSLPEQWPLVEQVIMTGQPALTRPINLVQGGVAIIYRLPITIDGEYWGLISTVIDIDSLLHAAFSDLQWAPPYALTVAESDDGPAVLVAGDDEVVGSERSVVLTTERHWRYVVSTGYFERNEQVLLWARAGGWLVALILSLMAALLMKQRAQLARMALYDPVTGLPNRHLFDDRLALALQRLARRSTGKVYLFMLDLDGFKEVNDLHGHRVGDLLLRMVADRLQLAARAEDTVARWAGDEFVLVVEDGSSVDPVKFGDRLRDALSDTVVVEGQPLTVGASIGCAIAPDDGSDGEHLFSVADERMYRDKRQRRALP